MLVFQSVLVLFLGLFWREPYPLSHCTVADARLYQHFRRVFRHCSGIQSLKSTLPIAAQLKFLFRTHEPYHRQHDLCELHTVALSAVELATFKFWQGQTLSTSYDNNSTSERSL